MPSAQPEVPNEIAVDKAMQEAYTVFVEKNRLYGGSIEETGVLGAIVECVAKNARLRELVLRHPQAGAQAPEDVRQNLLDLLNYCAIGMVMIDKENWKGIEK